MKRGAIYWVNLEPSHPPEFGKIRPCLVVSNSEQNFRLNTLVVVPISSQPHAIWPLRVEIELTKKKSYVVIPGIRQISKTRLTEPIEVLDVDDIKKIDEALELYLRD